ncbi:MAG: NADH-quinone oxidoreductase subunit NuoE [Rhodospirillales bacterium]
MNNSKHDPQELEGFVFSEDTLAAANAEITKYPEGRQASAVMPLLDLAQRQCNGWLPRVAMDYVADFLDMPPIKVYEVATFYTMYNLAPIGKYHVQVCTNLPCWLRGSDDVTAACKKNLGIEFGQTSSNGDFTLSEVECLGACVNAPMIQINDDYYEDLDGITTASILTQLAIGDNPQTGSQVGRNSCEPAGGLTTLTKINIRGSGEE